MVGTVLLCIDTGTTSAASLLGSESVEAFCTTCTDGCAVSGGGGSMSRPDTITRAAISRVYKEKINSSTICSPLVSMSYRGGCVKMSRLDDTINTTRFVVISARITGSTHHDSSTRAHHTRTGCVGPKYSSVLPRSRACTGRTSGTAPLSSGWSASSIGSHGPSRVRSCRQGIESLARRMRSLARPIASRPLCARSWRRRDNVSRGRGPLCDSAEGARASSSSDGSLPWSYSSMALVGRYSAHPACRSWAGKRSGCLGESSSRSM